MSEAFRLLAGANGFLAISNGAANNMTSVPESLQHRIPAACGSALKMPSAFKNRKVHGRTVGHRNMFLNSDGPSKGGRSLRLPMNWRVTLLRQKGLSALKAGDICVLQMLHILWRERSVVDRRTLALYWRSCQRHGHAANAGLASDDERFGTLPQRALLLLPDGSPTQITVPHQLPIHRSGVSEDRRPASAAQITGSDLGGKTIACSPSRWNTRRTLVKKAFPGFGKTTGWRRTGCNPVRPEQMPSSSIVDSAFFSAGHGVPDKPSQLQNFCRRNHV